MLIKLGVSSSGYYSWKKRKPSGREKRKAEIKEEIKGIYIGSKKIYGSPKITKELRNKGYEISQKTVSKYMKEEGIKAVWIKKFKPLVNKVPVRGLKNIVNREFKPERKNKIWVTDITYIWTTRGFVYLSSIMELYSRKGNPVGQYGIESFHSIIKREWLNRRPIDKNEWIGEI